MGHVGGSSLVFFTPFDVVLAFGLPLARAFLVDLVCFGEERVDLDDEDGVAGSSEATSTTFPSFIKEVQRKLTDTTQLSKKWV